MSSTLPSSIAATVRAVVFTVAFCLAPAAQATYELTIEAPPALKELLTQHLDLSRYRNRKDLNEDQLNFMLATAGDQVAKLAGTEGYFSPHTESRVEHRQGKTVVYLTVTAGKRTNVSSAHIGVRGAAEQVSPKQVDRVRKRWSLPPGQPFRQQDWDSAKDSGLHILQNRNYAAARIAESEARIDADSQEAELSVEYDSGPAFTLGPLSISGAQRYPEAIVRNVSPLLEGEPYDTERLLSLQRQILKTPYYSNVVVGIDRDPAKAERAPVKVEVTEYPTQRLTAGVGFSTDTGASVSGRYSHNDVLGKGWVFDSQARLEQRRQTLDLSLSMIPDAWAFVNSAQVSLSRTTLSGVDLRSQRFGLWRSRSLENYDLAFKLQLYRDSLTQLNGAELPADTIVLPGNHEALVASIEWTRRKIDDPQFPRRGNIISVELGGAAAGLLTEQSFVRGDLRIKQFYPAGKRDLVILRGEVGAVVTSGGNAAIPASLLFRTGGTDSVRGYQYQSIGTEVGGKVYPARYLATGGVEYQHWFTREWGGAVFYDVGTATDNWPDKEIFQGIGIGARWRSPVGPVNADLGYGIERGEIRPHFSLGIAF